MRPIETIPVSRYPSGSRAYMAWQDILSGARAWYLWGHLGWHDIRQHYRRSTIGPLWITISTGVLIGALGYLYTYLFQQEVSDYLPYLAGGYILWGLMAGLINEGGNVFIASAATLKESRIPITTHVYRVVWRNFIIYFHNIAILVAVLLIFQKSPGWTWPLAIPGLALFALNGIWVGLLLGTTSARFRDIPSLVASIIQIAFFLTPILWKPDMREDLFLFVNLNPFYHLIQVVRAPMLGELPSLHNWIAACAITAAGWAIAFAVFSRFRGRLVYWA